MSLRLAIVACLAALPSLRAQAPQSELAQDPEPVVHLRGVEVRRPDAMHPDQIQLVGLEQGSNSFRNSTPALSMGNTAPKLIDPDELYRSRMALYGEPGFEPAPAAETEGPRRRPAPPAAEEPSVMPTAGTVTLVLAVLAVGVIGLRRMRAARD